ncbi:MAG: glycosyltransferase family 2 protein [Xenococcus sp. MO_188.B8]|nr:glycosyltransferase family 2 protein [Xenococcus sp. MO_188.B8]
MLKEVTPLILTYNEAPNIERTLKKLEWATKIIIIDSYSTDNTLELVKAYPQAQVFQKKFNTHAQQWNYGLEKVETEWVLSLDADYVLTDELITEIQNISSYTSVDGFYITFKYCIFGKPLRASILPPRQALFRKKLATYIDDGHTQLLKVSGQNSYLVNFILHDDRKSLTHWLWAQDRYMILEAKKLTENSFNKLSLGDKIRKQIILAPGIIFLYCLIIKAGILDGWIGWYYALQRMLAEIILSIKLIELKISKL